MCTRAEAVEAKAGMQNIRDNDILSKVRSVSIALLSESNSLIDMLTFQDTVGCRFRPARLQRLLDWRQRHTH